MPLAACGFQPIYGGGGDGIQRRLATIEVLAISDRSGQQLRNHLVDLLNPFGRPRKPRFLLRVEITEVKQELAVRRTEFATRANLRFTASYQLSRAIGDRPVLANNSRIVASYNLLDSESATVIAERDARRRAMRELAGEIANRLAAFLQLDG